MLRHARWLSGAATAFLVLIAAPAGAQSSLCLFDPAGNFQVQAAETNQPPQILSQPQMQVVQPGALASFSVVALDTSGLSYQWQFNSTNIPGATSDTLFITSVSLTNQGYYSVVLANSWGSVTSSPAPLWIDSRGCGMPDWWQLQYFGNLNQNATADYTGDGVPNLQKFLDGTNPTNSASTRYQLALFSDGGLVQVVPDQSSYSQTDVVTLTATAVAPDTFHAWTGDVMSQSNTVTLTMNTNKTVFARFSPIDYYWVNPSGGDWSDPSNWTGAYFTTNSLVPLPTDNAHIIENNTVTVTNDTECLGLFLGDASTAPTFSVSATMTLHGGSFWYGGPITGGGRVIIDTGASLTISSTGVGLRSTLENGGTILWTAGNIIGGGAILTNRPGALFEAQTSAQLNLLRFDNAGTYSKTMDPGTNTVTAAFNNPGTLDLEAGTLLFNLDLTNTGTVLLAPGTTNRFAGSTGLSSGPFNAPPGSLVEQDSGTFTLLPGAQLNGEGLYRLNGGVLVDDIDLTVTNLDYLDDSGDASLDGSGTLTIDNVMNWTGGTMTGSGRTVISPGATLNLAVATGVTLSRTLENAGTVLWTGAGSVNVDGGILTNDAGALFQQQGAGSFANFDSPHEFDNSGVFQKAMDPGTNTVGINFNNYGTVDIESGTLVWYLTLTNWGTIVLAPGATNRFVVANAVSSGPFNASPTALVELRSGTLTLVPGAQLNGGGLYRLNGGVLLDDADLSVSNLDYVNNAGGAALDGSGTLTIDNVMNWTTGTMTGSGRMVIAPGASLNLASANGVTLNRTLDNAGTILWTGAGTLYFDGGIITNRPGALFAAQNAAALSPFFSPYRFDNAGIFRKSLSTGTTTVGVPFTNYGTVDLQVGILAANNGYASSSNALLNCALGGATAGANYGQLQVAGSVSLGGTLNVVLTNGFIPATNDTFTVLTAGALNGTFANFYYPSNAVTMQLSNTASSVIVQVTGVAIPPPLLLSAAISGSNVLLTWTAFPSTTYRVEFNPNLAPSNWSALAGDVTSSSNFAAKLDPLIPSNRYYRLRVLP